MHSDRPSPWWSILGVFDLETTGIDVRTSRIVSAHVGLLDADGSVMRSRDWIADPGVEIPEQATAVHGITTERARTEGRRAPDVIAEIIHELRMFFDAGIPVVIYNAPYDLSLLAAEAERHGVEPIRDPSPIIDPLVIDKEVDRYRRGKRTLAAAAEFYGVDLLSAHEASSDAIAAGRVAQAIARTYTETLDVAPGHLHGLQVDWCRTQAESFQDYMRRTRDPAFVSQGTWPVR
ncbi:3'-5' exonuclease [Labedella endophytica]|uniref:3'-5' exonuclease n=1 Tax=Labedella endophytica TaxID=1523160 RepID=A0A433JQW8_9MICO|nr:3'-5' exonuclease [Labedella endophytica]RUR00651.1 3'-5' exonuclease [Labedella endophytica]